MRADARELGWSAPQTLEHALQLLAEFPEARPFAGGTDAMVQLSVSRTQTTHWINLWGLAELSGITEAFDRLVLGATTTFAEIRNHELCRQHVPMLVSAARQVGSVAIQNRATLGGNIANASPAADSSPALLAYGALLELVSARGVRIVPYESFHTGYRTTVLEPGELIRSVHLPLRSLAGSRAELYRKVGPRSAQAISKVCFAGFAEKSQGVLTQVRIALAGVAPVVVRCREVESLLLTGGSIRELSLALAKDIRPIDDIRSTAIYRGRVAENLLALFHGQLRRLTSES